MEELSIGQLSVLCSSLARGCQKQYKFKEEQEFKKLANYFAKITQKPDEYEVEKLTEMIMTDSKENYKNVEKVAKEKNDRGALRAKTWGEKVTMILGALMQRYSVSGEKLLEDTKIWICTTCGFVYIGDNPPEKCPICKVPSTKFEEVTGKEEL